MTILDNFSFNLNLSRSDDHTWATFLASHHFHQHAFSHQLAASLLVSTTIVRVFAFLTSVNIRLRIRHLYCTLVSVSAITQQTRQTVLLLPTLLPWIGIAPLPCLGCFCTVLLCCLITWSTHSHPFRAPVYCGCQTGATGVLIHPSRAVDHQCANPLAAALLLHCTELYTCVRVRPY